MNTDQAKQTPAHLELRLRCADCGDEFDRAAISRAEFDALAVDLPDREAMSLLGSGLLGGGLGGGGLPLGGAPVDPGNPGATPTQGAPGAPVDPMGLMSKFAPDPDAGGSGPYSPETSSSSQT